MKESVGNAKKLTREMQVYWKRKDRAKKAIQRRNDRKTEEKLKKDLQLMEAKRQERKLNFLITQSELYAHFMSKKFGAVSNPERDENVIVNQLDESESRSPHLSSLDDYDRCAFSFISLVNTGFWLRLILIFRVLYFTVRK